MSIEIVVAHYNEDLSWIYPFSKHFNIRVYSKGAGGNLPNVGSCDHTYLHHIISNYDELAENTIFVPGSCHNVSDRFFRFLMTFFDCGCNHSRVAFYKINEDLYNFKIDEYSHTNSPGTKDLVKCEVRPFGKWMEEIVGLEINKIGISYGGIFNVSKKDILKHPKSFYEKLISQVDKHPYCEASHYMERAWASIFP
jgi:hypothetical protein